MQMPLPWQQEFWSETRAANVCLSLKSALLVIIWLTYTIYLAKPSGKTTEFQLSDFLQDITCSSFANPHTNCAGKELMQQGVHKLLFQLLPTS